MLKFNPLMLLGVIGVVLIFFILTGGKKDKAPVPIIDGPPSTRSDRWGYAPPMHMAPPPRNNPPVANNAPPQMPPRNNAPRLSNFMISASDFNALRSSGDPFVVAFMSETCPACINAKPQMEQAAQSSNVPFHGLYISPESQSLFGQYQIGPFPTLIRFENGAPAQKQEGFNPAALAQLLQ